MSVVFEEILNVMEIDKISRSNDYNKNPNYDLIKLNKTTDKEYDYCLPVIKSPIQNTTKKFYWHYKRIQQSIY